MTTTDKPEATDGPPSRPRSHVRNPRRRARELALQGVYQWLVGGHDEAAIEAHLAEIPGVQRADPNLLRTLLHGVIEGAPALRLHFVRYLDRDLALISPVEHALLLLGTYELAHLPEVPFRVVINEAVDLARGYGGTDGYRYVNGVLDKVAADLRPHESTRA